jgi:hypothetical protein
LEEEFKGLETSDNELCCLEEFDAMAGKTWYICPSSVTEVTLAKMREDGWFSAGRVMPPPDGETTPNPLEGYIVVSRDFFSCGLQFPHTSFLGEVLKALCVQLHYLTPTFF